MRAARGKSQRSGAVVRTSPFRLGCESEPAALLELSLPTNAVEASVKATPTAVSMPVNNAPTPTPATTTAPESIPQGATKPVSHTTTQPVTSSHGVGQAIGRALWNASVQTFAGSHSL